MLGIITIIQNKRIALPYIFGKYIFPKMVDLFPGHLALYHIFHNASVQNKYFKLDSNSLDDKYLENVRKAVRDNLFSNAYIMQHSEINEHAPALPSFRRAASISADFHLWMEDDAIICDLDCDKWATTLGPGDVGLYRPTVAKEMINTAYFLSTLEFDKRFSFMLQEYKRNMTLPANKGLWDNFAGKGSQIEHTAFRAGRFPIELPKEKAIRHHVKQNSTYKSTTTDLKAWLIKKIPNIEQKDLDLIDKDGFKD